MASLSWGAVQIGGSPDSDEHLPVQAQFSHPVREPALFLTVQWKTHVLQADYEAAVLGAIAALEAAGYKTVSISRTGTGSQPLTRASAAASRKS